MLRLAYLVNILILAPVAFAMLTGPGAVSSVFENKFGEAPELRVLVGCLWFAILVGSVVGLFVPAEMVGILLLQIVYKALFIALVLRPLYLEGGAAALPMGLSVTFLAIVLVWPVLLAIHWLR